MSDTAKDGPEVTPYFAIAAEGQRIGLCCCRICGAVLLIGDKDFDSPKEHREWHKAQSKRSTLFPPRIR